MILAFHLIWGMYGFWLPNDPRGSWSTWVASWGLHRYGPATKVKTHRSLAGRQHDRALRLAAKSALKYPPVTFNGEQAQVAVLAFGAAGYPIHACAVLPDHVHLVVGRVSRPIMRVVGHLKADASRALAAAGLHPMERFRDRDGGRPTPWCHKAWKVFLDTPEDVARAVRYVERNPVKEGKRRQRWSFVTPPPI